jgi:uncharacterized membrane protein HdeD (DUF308 family)
MKKSYQASHSRLLKTEGILTLILGSCAILFPTLFALGLELLLGGLFLVGGLITVFRAARLREVEGNLPSLLFGLVAAGVGVWLLSSPVMGVVTLTLMLAIVFFVQGVAEITTALQHRKWPTWGWALISGIASWAIAAFLFLGLPGTAAWAIGLLVGINLIFTGAWLLALGSAVSKSAEPLQQA